MHILWWELQRLPYLVAAFLWPVNSTFAEKIIKNLKVKKGNGGPIKK